VSLSFVRSTKRFATCDRGVDTRFEFTAEVFGAQYTLGKISNVVYDARTPPPVQQLVIKPHTVFPPASFHMWAWTHIYKAVPVDCTAGPAGQVAHSNSKYSISNAADTAIVSVLLHYAMQHPAHRLGVLGRYEVGCPALAAEPPLQQHSQHQRSCHCRRQLPAALCNTAAL
jgi:hypothetical protein